MSTTVTDLTELVALGAHDLGRSDWLTVSQDRINTFADATGDHQWIHVDPERAAGGPFKGAIAHGYLTLSLIVPLFTTLLTVERRRLAVNYGLNKVRFPTPVPAGSRVRLHAAIASSAPLPGEGVELAVDMTIELEDAPKPACVAQMVMRFYA